MNKIWLRCFVSGEQLQFALVINVVSLVDFLLRISNNYF